jgi:hypothetical protein
MTIISHAGSAVLAGGTAKKTGGPKSARFSIPWVADPASESRYGVGVIVRV